MNPCVKLATGIALVWRQADVNDGRSYLNDGPLGMQSGRTTRQTPASGCSNSKGQVEPRYAVPFYAAIGHASILFL